MGLFKPEDLKKGKTSLNYPGGEYFAWFFMYILRFHKLNRLYARIENKQGLEFIEEVIKILNLTIKLDENELKRIPAKGPAIIVANHPLGGLEGLILIKMLSAVRTDIKIIAGYLLRKVEPLSQFFVATNPFEITADSSESAYSGLKEILTHLREGGILCVFPAEGAGIYDVHGQIIDKIWRFPIIKFIKKIRVPVVPVLFQSGNNRFFQLISKIHPSLKNVRLPSEFFHKPLKNILIRIGNPVKVADQEKFSDVYQFGRYLRAKTYGMATPIEVKKFFNYSLSSSPKPEPVISEVPKEEILREIAEIRYEYLLFKQKEYNVFAVPTGKIPRILTEIGRLREITFREVGEGTNQNIDIDEFDLYYNQMFIWDEKNERIVGAYRIGIGREIMEQYGKRGFYLHTLFRIDDSLADLLGQSLELGRSFVVKEYQKKPMPLFLLWKGILSFMLKNPEYRYLLGPVSISNNYSPISKDLIIRFIMTNHYNWNLAKKIRPRNAYKFRSDDPNINILMDSTDRDINKLDKTIGDMDALNSGLPVLLKKYIQLNAKIVCFNVDPKFNNCLDGLIILDIYDVPKATLESLHKEVNDGSILERFYSNRE